MNCKIFYWKDPKYLRVGMGVDVPTPKQVETDYALFWSGEVDEETTPEDLFIKYNSDNGCIELPPGIEHTSMSIGDIVMLNGKLHICKPTSWQEIQEID